MSAANAAAAVSKRSSRSRPSSSIAQSASATSSRKVYRPTSLPGRDCAGAEPDEAIHLSTLVFRGKGRSEEHTSELQSRGHLVCRLLLEKKKKTHNIFIFHKRN